MPEAVRYLQTNVRKGSNCDHRRSIHSRSDSMVAERPGAVGDERLLSGRLCPAQNASGQ